MPNASPFLSFDNPRNRGIVRQIMPATAVLASAFTGLVQFLRRWWNHTPLTALLVFVLISLKLGENYPFSNFPMYGNPGPDRPYFNIADGQGNDLPIATLTGVTTSKIGKIYRSKEQETAKRLNLDEENLPQSAIQQIGLEIFAFLRENAATRQQILPEHLQLILNNISYEESTGKILDTHLVLARD